MRVLILLACLVAAVCAEKARYDNYVVYRVVPSTQEQLTSLQQLQDYPEGMNFWTEPGRLGVNVDIMVAPHKQPEFKSMMAKSGIQMSVFIADVQEKIDNENPPTAGKAMDWVSYHRIVDIYGWLDDLVATYPGQVTAIQGGTSFEGRQLRGVKVSFGAGKPGVFIESGIHAREWISSATTTYILNEILTSTDPAVRAIAEAYDWHVFPLANPDGYEFCHTNDRLWRKTRSNNGGSCYGADPNRNWGFHWLGGGSSTNPCSDTYAGTAAFSESETRGLSNYITSVASSIHVYLAFHSYSQYILIPYGITEETIPNFAEHQAFGDRAETAIAQKFGTRFVAGNIVDLLYVASGGSMDWAKGTYPNIRIAYTFELRDTGANGFILPANQIIPSGQETLDGVVSILNDALTLL